MMNFSFFVPEHACPLLLDCCIIIHRKTIFTLVDNSTVIRIYSNNTVLPFQDLIFHMTWIDIFIYWELYSFIFQISVDPNTLVIASPFWFYWNDRSERPHVYFSASAHDSPTLHLSCLVRSYPRQNWWVGLERVKYYQCWFVCWMKLFQFLENQTITVAFYFCYK